MYGKYGYAAAKYHYVYTMCEEKEALRPLLFLFFLVFFGGPFRFLFFGFNFDG